MFSVFGKRDRGVSCGLLDFTIVYTSDISYRPIPLRDVDDGGQIYSWSVWSTRSSCRRVGAI